ncbi:MAG: hypothetical protein IKZ17_01385 [Bacteroidaceae bacterium]|nr:hypothetical protein [Bacteroidaceae bacterium]
MEKELRVCSCGRIHFLNKNIIHAAIEVNKDVLFICGNCGRATFIGADCTQDYWNGSNETVYEMYAYDASGKDFLLSAQNFKENAYGEDESKRIFRVLYSVGKPVLMMTGMNATSYTFGKFEDGWHPDLHVIQKEDVTVKEIRDHIAQWRRDRQTVNMNWMLHILTDEEAEMLFTAHIPGLDWTGTKYKGRD